MDYFLHYAKKDMILPTYRLIQAEPASIKIKAVTSSRQSGWQKFMPVGRIVASYKY